MLRLLRLLRLLPALGRADTAALCCCCCCGPLQAASPGEGLAASLLGAAAHAVHAVQEQLHSVLEHGRELAAAEDTAEGVDMVAGGGSIAGSMREGEGEEGTCPLEEGEQQAQPRAEEGPQQETAEQEAEVPVGGPVGLAAGAGPEEEAAPEAAGVKPAGAEAGGASVVLPVSPQAHQQTMKVRGGCAAAAASYA